MEIGLYTFAELRHDPVTGAVADARRRLRDLVEEAELAEQAGLAVFGIGEHHRIDFAVPAPAVLLSAIAARTSRIRLTSAVTVLSSADPVSVFEEFAMLDLLSDGRTEIMAGRGAFTESFPLFGYRIEDYDALFDEKIGLLLMLRDHERITWSGRFRPALEDQEVFPRPVQQPLPVWIGVGGQQASVIRAARLGAPMALAVLSGQLVQAVPLVRLYRSTLADAGHDPATARIATSSHAFVGDTSQAAAEFFFPYYSGYVEQASRGRFAVDRTAFDAGREPDNAIFVGSPAQVVEKILYQHELLGHQRFLAQISVGTLPHDAIMHAIELLGTEVLPKVQAALGE